MRNRGRGSWGWALSSWLVLAIALVAGAGCTAVLGDFTVGAGGDGGSSGDATVDAPADDGGPDATEESATEGGDDALGEAASDAFAGSDGSSDAAAEAAAACSPSTCPNGCCLPTGLCLPYANQNTTTCGTGGLGCVGCPSGQECNANGKCACDAKSCPNGCCDSNGQCQTSGDATCGIAGAACATCPKGQGCNAQGQCACDSTTCSGGCCNGGPTGTCELYASQTGASCGSSGATCAACGNGLCDTTNGTCACDPNTCPTGCCVNGTCEAYGAQSLASCGTGGNSCSACGANANACTTGQCECNGAVCAATSVCCGSTGCVDVQNDGNNCGACGHSCLGGTCAGGLCQPTVLGQTVNKAGFGITVDSASVYVTENLAGGTGYVETCPLGGCPGSPPTATVLYTVTGNPSLSRIYYDNGPSPTGYLYFGANNQTKAYAIKTDGTLVFSVSDGSPYGFTTDATNLYIADYQGISYVSKTTGGTATSINSASLGYTRAVEWDPSSSKLWAASPNNSYLAQCPTSPGTCTSWAESTDAPYDVHVVGGVPFFLTQTTGLYKCASASDCSLTTATQLSSWSGEGFAVDASNVYFADYGQYVYTCPAAGCSSPIKLAPSQGYVQTMVADSQWLYWITSTGQILKVAK